jgi:hypothetical protein
MTDHYEVYARDFAIWSRLAKGHQCRRQYRAKTYALPLALALALTQNDLKNQVLSLVKILNRFFF